jgi:hypothetical protein
MPDLTASARVKRWRARKRGEAVPHLKPGRPPRPHTRDDFLDLSFIAVELQRLAHDNAELRKEFAQIRGHLYKVAQRLDDNHARMDEILRLVRANLEPIAATPPAEPSDDLYNRLRDMPRSGAAFTPPEPGGEHDDT